MSDQLLVVLRVCLLVLMYLVFLRVLRAVWAEMRSGPPVRPRVPGSVSAVDAARVPASAAVPVPPGRPPATPALVAVEPPHLVGTAYALDQETTIGRAAGCRIAVDDTHVSKVHARVFTDGDQWYVDDLGSTNGTLVNEQLLTGPAAIEPGDRIRVGETVLELR